MRVWRIALIGLIAAHAVIAQPPGDPEEILARTREKILDRTDRLPNYICVQTVNRRYFRRKNPEVPTPSCDKMSGEKARNDYALQLEATDRLRLDVMVSGGTEIGAWAGSSQFGSGDVMRLTSGPFGTGGFGTFLIDIFTTPSVPFSFEGEESVNAVKLFRYRFRVGRDSSHYAVHAGGKWAYTGYDGQIWVDPATFDLRHLLVRTAELPSESNACESSTTVDYASIPIGDGEFLLPLDSNLHFLMRDTTETEVRINYSSCHQFLGEAKLVEQPDLAVSQPTPRASPVPIAAGLLISLKFTQAIDSDVAAAGDVLLAKVTKAVRDPASSKVLIAAGSLVQARLVGMEHWLGQTPRFAFTIQLETVELEGVTTPIYARLPTASEEKDALKKKPDLMVRNEFYLAPRGQSRPAAHHVIYTKDKRCAIPRGYQMRFVTVDPAATQ